MGEASQITRRPTNTKHTHDTLAVGLIAIFHAVASVSRLPRRRFSWSVGHFTVVFGLGKTGDRTSPSLEFGFPRVKFTAGEREPSLPIWTMCMIPPPPTAFSNNTTLFNWNRSEGDFNPVLMFLYQVATSSDRARARTHAHKVFNI